MGWKTFFSFIFFLMVIFLLVLYWFIPFDNLEFGLKPKNSNFNINSSNSSNMQFYPNMRYSDSKISYKIENCTLQKKQDMEQAFEILSNQTLLNFYRISSDPEISVYCDSRNRIEKGLFIAGEGGPTNISLTNNFNVILNGQILLIKDSQCAQPNIALHELLHTLGFAHSSNPNNIMYAVSKCKQTIGLDIIEMINFLYSYPSYPDLTIENISAVMSGRSLDAKLNIKNYGLKDSEDFKILIYADEKLLKEIEMEPLEIGYGRIVSLEKILVTKIKIDQLRFLIKYDFEELDKEDNSVVLEIKK